MKKLLLLFICFTLLCGSFVLSPFTQPVEAKTKKQLRVKVDQKISEWVIDEKREYIYAISKESNQLLFIRMDNLKVEKRLTIGSIPSDLVLDGTKLYIALSGSTSIGVVDVDKQASIESLPTSKKPLELAIDGEKLFYVSEYYSSDLYAYNLTSKKEEAIDFTSKGFNYFNFPDIVTDTQNHILYIGESRTSDANAIAISTKDYKILHNTTYKGFSDPIRKIIFDGNSVYFDGSRLNGNNLAIIDGSYKTTDERGYSQTDDIIYVKDHFVFSKTAVYDRDKYVPIMQLPIKDEGYWSDSIIIKVAMDSSNNVILYDSREGAIVKIQLKVSLPKTEFKKDGNKMIFRDEINDWTYDRERHVIYAIQKNSNKLLYVDANNLKVKEELFIGSHPTDVEYYDNKLYVALSGSSKVAMVDLQRSNDIELIEIEQSPYKLAIFKEKIYSIGDYYSKYLNKYHFLSKENEIVIDRYFGQTYFATDHNKQLLYIADGSVLHIVDVKKDKKIDEIDEIKGGGRVFISEDDLFFGKERRQRDKWHFVKGTYDEPIIYAHGDYVFSAHSVFDKESYTKSIKLPFEVRDVFVDRDGAVFLYSVKDKTISKYESIESLKKSAVVSKLESSPDNIVAFVWDKKIHIKVTATYQDGKKEDVTSFATWLVKDSKVCSVYTGGNFSANKAGTTVVTATYKEQSVDIPVTIIDFEKIIFEPEDITLKKGEQQTVTVTAVYTDQTKQDVTELAYWKSYNPKVAQVSKGKIKAIGEGETMIYVSYGGDWTSIKVKVESVEKQLKKLVSSTKAATLKINQQKTVKVKAYYTDGSSEYVTNKVEWTSSNPEIASVSNGVIKGKGEGNTTITGKFADKSITVSVTVKK